AIRSGRRSCLERGALAESGEAPVGPFAAVGVARLQRWHAGVPRRRAGQGRDHEPLHLQRLGGAQLAVAAVGVAEDLGGLRRVGVGCLLALLVLTLGAWV